jgi:membrane protease YdiL (CAAX protease family)
VRSETLLRRYPLTSYFVLVYALAWGGILWVVEWLADSASSASPAAVGMVALPMLFAPGLAALALTALVEGKAGLRALWARMMRWRVGLRWYALAVVALPLLVLAILYTLGALVSPVYAPTLALLGLAGLLAGYLEEIGWTGYATPRLLARWSPVKAGWWLGALWGVWHALADYVIRGSTLGTFWPVTFGLFVLPLIAWRILMTVVYARTQSGVIAQLMHFAYTGSLAAFIPLAAISPMQDALVYAILAGTLWLAVAGLAVGSAKPQPLAPTAPPARLDGP